MIELPEEFDSIFRYIVVVSQRAEQLINGAKARTESRYAKHTLAAKHDVDSGEVNWRVLTQAELDARRQEIVDQLRAEVSGVEGEGEAQVPIPDVLPTAVVAAVEAGVADASERDDELARLQRLLGMATGVIEAEEQADDDEGAQEAAGEDEEKATEVDLSEVEALEKKREDKEEEED